MEKKAKKKVSVTATIKKLKERCESWRQDFHSKWDEWNALRKELDVIHKYVPRKFYEVKFKMLNNSQAEHTYMEVHQAYGLEHAIMLVKYRKTYPDSFKLIDVRVLG